MEKVTIVCVDDEQRILNSLKMLLKKEYNVKTTIDGHEAVKYLRMQKTHVIISDQRMPNITGVEVLAKANQVSPNTVRILLTGYSDLTAVVGSINEGEIYRFVNKPWSNKQLQLLVRRAVSISEGLWNDGSVASAGAVNVEDKQSTPVSEPLGNQNALNLGALVLDQDTHTMKLLKRTVACANLSLHAAKSLDEALVILEKHNIGVVIADLNCGKDNVLEFINVLKAEHPLVLTIILTELMDFSSIVSLINEGQVFRYLPKPVTVKQLEVPLTLAIKRHERYANNPALLKQHEVATQATLEMKEKAVAKQSMAQRFSQRLRGLKQRLGYKVNN